MKNFFPEHPELTNDQIRVLEAQPNLIVKGAAGTGKTMLAILLAEKLVNIKGDVEVAIIISTKSLKYFISEALNERNIKRCSVYHLYEWHKKYSKQSDYIIIDEAQDFSLKQIKEITQLAKIGVYILGDSKQKIFSTSIVNKEPTTTIDEIERELHFQVFSLDTNVRFNESIMLFIKTAYPDIDISSSKIKDDIKPQIIYCTSYKQEIEKVSELINSGILEGSTGIFLPRNDIVIKEDDNKVKYGILEIVEYLKSFGITEIGYKYYNDENLFFSDANSVNVMTYHSAKGLEFDNVVLLFVDMINQIPDSYIYYVGFSRARKRLVLTYTDNFNNSLKYLKNSTNTFIGEINRPIYINQAIHIIESYKIQRNSLKSIKQIYLDSNLPIDSETEKEEREIERELENVSKILDKAGLNKQMIEEFINSRIIEE